ncbi:MAG: NAD(P)/FAD-dependent oxidoreductase [Clostridiales bacterium]|nr:NAD(P)/FAD-dependent oxidoreductase [Clostridiales bacterium]
MHDVVVIGGGAAGMLASAVAAERGLRVLLLEKNDRPGLKLRITGKGRCNVTNNCTVKEAIDNIPTGGRFLMSALSCFTPQDTKSLFEKLGVPMKTERGGRVFPVSDKAADVVSALRRYMDSAGVETVKGTAKSIRIKEGRVEAVTTAEGEFSCRTAVLCTGGVSYPLTGATGDGYKIAAALGHTIVPAKASLEPLEASPEICSRMQGLSLKNIRLTVTDGGKKPVFEDFGELLFTHFGVSGPLVLSASAHMRTFKSKRYILSIDLKPALDDKKLDARLLRDFEKYHNRDFSNALGDLASKMMIPVLVELSGIPPETKVNSVTREQRGGLRRLLKDFRLEVQRPRPIEEAIITSGGVDTREINPKTMESKRVKGLHFAGEIIDADAYTGGYNLQIAWSTAYAAASHINCGY